MKRRLLLGVVASVLAVSTSLVGGQPATAAGVKVCNLTGQLRPSTPLQFATPTTTAFTQSLSGPCSDGTSESMTTNGTLTGSCTVWNTPPSTTTSSSTGTSTTTTTTVYPTTSVTVGATVTMTATLTANGGTGFNCLGLTGSVTYYVVAAVAVIVSI